MRIKKLFAEKKIKSMNFFENSTFLFANGGLSWGPVTPYLKTFIYKSALAKSSGSQNTDKRALTGPSALQTVWCFWQQKKVEFENAYQRMNFRNSLEWEAFILAQETCEPTQSHCFYDIMKNIFCFF